MKKGWFKESHRHYLAAKGIKTNRYTAKKSKYFIIKKTVEVKGTFPVKEKADETKLGDIRLGYQDGKYHYAKTYGNSAEQWFPLRGDKGNVNSFPEAVMRVRRMQAKDTEQIVTERPLIGPATMKTTPEAVEEAKKVASEVKNKEEDKYIPKKG